jgi:virginiamycin B lyase
VRWICLALVVLALPGVASAAPAFDTAFDVSGMPQRLVLGSDGNIWFTLAGSSDSKEFGKVTPGGTVTEYDAPGDLAVVGITTGPDGKLWMSAPNNVVEVDPANPTGGTAHPGIDIVNPQTIVVGPDDNLWTASADKIFKIGLNGAEITHYTVSGLNARGIAAGGDGNIWVADFQGKRVLKAPTDGSGDPTDKFDADGAVQEIAPGPPGQLALTAPQDAPFYIGRIDYAGNIQKQEVPPATDPTGIVFANDQAYWTPEFAANQIGRLTPAGGYTQLPVPGGSGPRHITKGLGDTLWVGFQGSNKIARITGVSAPPPPVIAPVALPGGPGDATAPAVSGYAFESRVIRALPSGGSVARATRGTRVSYTLSEPATATFTVQRLAKGRKVRRRGKTRCVKPSRKNARRKKCTRRVRAGSFTRPSAAGANRFRFTGRVRNRALRPGRYRMLLVARDAAGNPSKPVAVRFRVVK